MTVSIVGQKLFQHKPDPGSYTHHGKSWKNLRGYEVNMFELRKRLMTNAKYKTYKRDGTINILADLTVKQIADYWSKITRKLRDAGVVAFWIREVSRRTNRCHYHLVIASDHSEEELKALVRAACPTLKFKMQFKEIRNGKHWCGYVTKSEQIHKQKVVLFHDDVNLRKHDVIGDFWAEGIVPKKLTKEDRKQRREQREAYLEAYHDDVVAEAASSVALATSQPEQCVRSELAWQWLLMPETRADIYEIAMRSYKDSDHFDYNREADEEAMFAALTP